ncbi:protein ndr1 [Phtheirospermum japonicum]|uniref:Protein ndr1 n=1 Tax=Phtheirospermum japonicum TaxID=374723 RepID=A0A830BYB0_9LAMI|nr:protein ndr1 [Phtheirospermum japonicum]
MAENGRGGAASCCCSFIFTSGLTALFMWLSLRTSKPTCSIQRFYVPALNQSQNSTANHTISFDLKLDNGMKDKGVSYDTINMNFSYVQQNSSRILLANYTEPGFYQGHGKKATRKNLVADGGGVPWEAAIDAASNGSTAYFRVDLATRVRYKIMFWHTKRESLVVGRELEVGSSGEKVKKKGIKLRSKSPELGCHWVRVGPVAVFTFLVILLL